MLRSCWIALASLSLLAAPAQASQLTFNFTATVTATDGTVVGLGDSLSGQFAYNDELSACGQTGAEPALVTFCNAGPGYTIGAEWFGSITFGSQTVSLSSSQADIELQIFLGRFVDPGDPSQGHGADSFHFSSQTGEFIIDLRNFGGTALGDPDGTFPSIPTAFDLAAWPDQSTLRSSNLGLGVFTAQLTTLTLAVPEPGSSLIVGLGLLGVLATRRKR
jgi:hypothetical protein